MVDSHLSELLEPPPLSIRLFGPLEVSVEGRPFPPVRSRATLWLLALLALNYDHPRERVWLACTLWPVGPETGRTQAQALACLRQRLSELRDKLGTQAWRLTTPTPRTLHLDLKDAEVDLIAFDAAVRLGGTEALERAIALYRGRLLEGLPAEIATIQLAADRRKERYQEALRRQAEHALERGDAAAAARYVRHLDSQTPPSLRLERARERLEKPSPLVAETGRLSSLYALPEPLTSLIGRKEEIEELQTCLRLRRLVTLTGTGGVGKTRLAIATAATVSDRFVDGTYLVDLAAARDPLFVPQAVAATLKVCEQPKQQMKQTLLDALRDRSLLLVLDNCEHLLKGCAELAGQLLEACRGVSILATSREALGVMGEQRYRVNSLAVPDLLPDTCAEKNSASLVMETAAARLFVERAELYRPAFALTAQNAQVVAQICRELDGNPLAIELAAARMGAMNVEDIAERLHHRFLLLVNRQSQSTLSRHHTLRAAMDWSHDLLSGRERALLRRLSVFSGGWTLAAAEQVCADRNDPAGWASCKEGIAEARGTAATTPGLHVCNVLDLLTSLVEKSLAQTELREGKAHYRMLETVREYAGEKLAKSGEHALMQERHRSWCLTLAEEAEAKLIGAEQSIWLLRLDSELGNLRGALALQDTGETRLRLAGALRRYWTTRGYVSEGRRWLEKSLAECREASEPARAKAMHEAGTLAKLQGDYAAAKRYLEDSLKIRRRLGDDRGVAASLNNLADIMLNQGDCDTARSYYEASLELWRALEDHWRIAIVLFNLGTVAIRLADYTTARLSVEQSLTLYKQIGDTTNIAAALDLLGSIACDQGDYGTARQYYEASLEIVRELGNKRALSTTLYNLGMMVREVDGCDKAYPLLAEALEMQHGLGAKASLLLTILYFVDIAIDRQDFSRATRLLAGAETLRASLGLELAAKGRSKFEQLLSALHSALLLETFQYHWLQGALLSLDELVTLASKSA